MNYNNSNKKKKRCFYIHQPTWFSRIEWKIRNLVPKRNEEMFSICLPWWMVCRYEISVKVKKNTCLTGCHSYLPLQYPFIVYNSNNTTKSTMVRQAPRAVTRQAFLLLSPLLWTAILLTSLTWYFPR